MRTRERNNPEAPRLPRLHERRLPRPSLEPSCRSRGSCAPSSPTCARTFRDASSLPAPAAASTTAPRNAPPAGRYRRLHSARLHSATLRHVHPHVRRHIHPHVRLTWPPTRPRRVRRYPVRKLLIDHHELLKPAGEPGQKPGITEAVVMDVSVSQHLHPTRPEPHLWSGMILQAKGDLAGAAAAYNASAALAAPYDWQGSYRLWRALLLLGDGAAAAREEEALRRRWGDAQMRWYSTDAYGDVLPAASE